MATKTREIPLEKIDDYRWRLPQSYKPGMRVPGIVYADEKMIRHIREEAGALEQVANVATLPGIVRASYAMPDIHWGYGFPVGGVAAFREDDGVIAAGGIGFDISCGMRVIRTDLMADDVRPRIERLADDLFRNVPSGVGAKGEVRAKGKDIDQVLRGGAAWAVEHGYGWPQDLEVIEEHGALREADAGAVSDRAKERGASQLGTLGSGNHLLELDYIDVVYDEAVAREFGIGPVGQVVALFHCGSRGLGYQVCDDYLGLMARAAEKHKIELADRQLACAPFRSVEGTQYFSAMSAAANFAWANRQVITHLVRETFAAVFGKSAQALGMRLVYDVAHNIAKLEEHDVDGKRIRVVVHRKGATRSFPPGHPELTERYRAIGQPVIIPGDMGRYSFMAVGTTGAMEQTFGSTCHGAGRMQSRHAAMKALRGVDIISRLRERGITVRVVSKKLLAEEASEAYKDVADVVEVCDRAGISRKVARMRPLAVVKG